MKRAILGPVAVFCLLSGCQSLPEGIGTSGKSKERLTEQELKSAVRLIGGLIDKRTEQEAAAIKYHQYVDENPQSVLPRVLASGRFAMNNQQYDSSCRRIDAGVRELVAILRDQTRLLDEVIRDVMREEPK